MKRITIMLPEQFIKDIKIEAIRQGLTLAEFIKLLYFKHAHAEKGVSGEGTEL